MDRAADLWTLVSNLKMPLMMNEVHILQMLGDKLINDCRIEVFGVTIEPLWVEAYCYDETHFPDLQYPSQPQAKKPIWTDVFP